MAGDGSGSAGTRMYVGSTYYVLPTNDIYIVIYVGICLIHPK